MTDHILVLDIGTSGLRAALVNNDGLIVDAHHVSNPPSTPFAGLVEFDALEMYDKAVDAAQQVLSRNPAAPVCGMGIANQRASTIVWDRTTGLPVGPALGWQDLRTIMECITAKAEHNVRFAPNQTATKAGWMLKNYGADLVARAERGEILLGTIDSWLTWKLSGQTTHVMDHTNAAVTGLVTVDGLSWDVNTCQVAGVPTAALPRLVASSSIVARIVGHGVLDGLPIAATVGDQQASLVGQGCISRGMAKITFGTGGMLDMYTGRVGPTVAERTQHGTFPIVAFSLEQNGNVEMHWGLEAIMLSAGTNIEWLRDDMGLIASAEESHTIASTVQSTEGVMYVPALLGLGTPDWDYGARGSLSGLTRGTTRAHVVRAVLEGVAHRGADLLAAATNDAAERSTRGDQFPQVHTLRIDGGMSNNETFAQALADATGCNVEVSSVTEATTLGAAYLAGTALSVWDSLEHAVATWRPARVFSPLKTPSEQQDARQQWRRALDGTRRWIPDLSALDF
jgi:glycerol kinase